VRRRVRRPHARAAPAAAARPRGPPEDVSASALSSGGGPTPAPPSSCSRGRRGAARRGARAVQTSPPPRPRARRRASRRRSAGDARGAGLTRRQALWALGVVQVAMLLLPIGWGWPSRASRCRDGVQTASAIRRREPGPVIAFLAPMTGIAHRAPGAGAKRGGRRSGVGTRLRRC
jgi:hypothetical protein